jgi:hypothetical protein
MGFTSVDIQVLSDDADTVTTDANKLIFQQTLCCVLYNIYMIIDDFPQRLETQFWFQVQIAFAELMDDMRALRGSLSFTQAETPGKYFALRRRC